MIRSNTPYYRIIGTLDAKNPAPLGIVLHGFGSGADNIHGLAECMTQLIADWYIPQGRINMIEITGFEGYAWFPQKRTELVEAVQGAYWKDLQNIDSPSIEMAAQDLYLELYKLKVLSRPLVIAGFSQGAMLSSELAILLARKGIIVRTMLLFSGALIAKKRWQEQIEQNNLKSKLGNINIWQSHGHYDTLLTMNNAKNLHEFWQQYANAELHVFDGSHEISEVALARALNFLKTLFASS